MSRATTSSETLTNRYVTALLDAAGASRTVVGGIKDVLAMVRGSTDLQLVLSSPVLTVKQQEKAVLAVLDEGRIDPILHGFVRVVLHNRRGGSLVQFLQAALEEMDRRAGIVQAKVEVAAPLNDIQQKKLSDTLARWSGMKVQLNVDVKPTLLGGLKVRLGSVQIDDSVDGKLQRLKQELLGARA